VTDRAKFVPWDQAWQEALYGEQGFYRRSEGPAGHFRTACHAGAGVLAGALIRLAAEGGCTTIVDVGAGRGELLTALAEVVAAEQPEEPPPHDLPGDLFARAGAGQDVAGQDVAGQDVAGQDSAGQDVAGRPALRLHGVDVVDRPAGLPASVGWSAGLDALPDEVLDGALVVAWELLDVVPQPIAELGPDGLRIVLVDRVTGDERPGPPLTALEAAWCARWWPLVDAEPGSRIEIGITRDGLWAGLVRRAAGTRRGGLLVAVDYGHDIEHRPAEGSLSAFQAGRAVPPVPDGSCDLTTHVALDAVAAAGERAGAFATLLLAQRPALRALGVGMTLGELAAAESPGALLARLEIRSQMDELLDPAGLGGFDWLVQGVHRPVPGVLRADGRRAAGARTR
jgi:SAM-dependent MidA family methyltransferase